MYRHFPLLLFFSLLCLSTLTAQNAFSLFVECECNRTLIRQRLDYVDHVLDQANADVFLFINTNYLPQGGRIYNLDFTGAGPFEGSKLVFELTVPSIMTSAERDEALTDRIELGLAGFVAGTEYAESVRVSVDREKAAELVESEEPVADPWKAWIFEVFSSVSFSNESLRKTSDLRAGINIEKATPEVRIRIDPYYSYWSRVFTTQDGAEILSFRKRAQLSASIVKSIGDHWSVGVFGSARHHSFININQGYWFAPAIEYNFFSYDEVPFKEFTAAYRVGMVRNNYLEETIFFQNEESLLRHILDVDLRLRQKWGNIFAGVTAGAYLNDHSMNRLSIDGRFDVRIVKGLSVNFSGGYQIINDQINLPRGDATLEDILLGQTQLATNFDSDLRFGLRYTFGSIYNNTVNTRL